LPHWLLLHKKHKLQKTGQRISTSMGTQVAADPLKIKVFTFNSSLLMQMQEEAALLPVTNVFHSKYRLGFTKVLDFNERANFTISRSLLLDRMRQLSMWKSMMAIMPFIHLMGSKPLLMRA